MRRFAPLVAALLMLVAGRPVSGQLDNWEKVEALPSGTRIELVLAGGKMMEGRLSQVSPDGLTLSRKRGALQVARSDIRRILVLSKGSRLKNAGIGALIGFGVGCPIAAAKAGYIADMNNPSFNTRAGLCLGIGGFFGGIAGGIGAALPPTRLTLVYRSPELKR